MIKEFQGEYRWLSNFHPVEISHGGLVFPSVENAYQAMKSRSYSFALKCSMCAPNIAKRLGKDPINKNDSFDDIKLNLMEELNLQKYTNNDELALLLAYTQNKKIVEGNYWHDNFWGNCMCPKCVGINGQNNLGKIIMKIRSLIIGD